MMAISNLALAKHLDGRPVVAEDIKVGLQVEFPSGLGGVITHKCVSIDAQKAQFNSINKEWPVSFVMEFDQPDFTREDFELLFEALVVFSKANMQPTDEQRDIVRRAHQLGYAHYMSYTQASWSEKGIDAYHAL